MSLIVGYIDKQNKMYYIAGDSAVSVTDAQKNVLSTHKVFRDEKHPEVLFGVVGEFKYCNIISSANLFDDYDENLGPKEEYNYMANIVAARLHNVISNDFRCSDDKEYQFEMLVVTKHNIYDFDNDFAVATYVDSWASLGCAWPCVNAVMCATQNCYDAIERITIAAYASARYIDGISCPLDILIESFDHDKNAREDFVVNEHTELTNG